MSHLENKNEYGEEEFINVMSLVKDYFDGLYFADVDKLRSIFHDDAFLKAPGLRRSLNEWLTAVSHRPVPAVEGLPYDFKLLSIEVVQDQAMVKLDCPLFEHAYLDYLGLLKEDGHWLIVNKMYTDLN